MKRVIAGHRTAPLEFRGAQTVSLCILISLFPVGTFPCFAQDLSRPSAVANPGTPPPGASARAASDDGPRPSEPELPPCASNAAQLDFLYPKIAASFVGGTIAGMPLTKGTLRRYNLFQTEQFRVNGSLAIGSCAMVFGFATKKAQKPEAEADASFQVLPCGPSSGAGLAAEGARLCNSGRPAGAGKSAYVIQIPYGKINVLARGRKGPGELNADTGTYLTAAIAVLSTVLGAVSSTGGKEVYGGATVLAGSIAYFFLIRRPSQGENYLAIYVRKKGADKKELIEERRPVDQVKNPNIDFLQKGDVLIFRVGNYHDYFNISMILTGKSGLELVSQGAEKGK